MIPQRREVSTPEEVFRDSPEGLQLYREVCRLLEAMVPASVQTTKSQIAFRHRRAFAYVWNPGRYIRSDAPAVLSIGLPRRLRSDRFKEIVHPSPSVWLHHMELRSAADLDAEVAGWLREAYDCAV
jgi:hypothetical protein